MSTRLYTQILVELLHVFNTNLIKLASLQPRSAPAAAVEAPVLPPETAVEAVLVSPPDALLDLAAALGSSNMQRGGRLEFRPSASSFRFASFADRRGRMATDAQVNAGRKEDKELQMSQINNLVQFRLLLLVVPVIRLQYCRRRLMYGG